MEIKEDEKQIDIQLNFQEQNNINNINNNLIDEDNNKSINNISIYLDSEIIPIIEQLVEMGFNKLFSQRLLAFYHPRTLEEAMNYFLKEQGIIQHFYIEDRKSIDKLCFLCGEQKEIHLGNIPENNIEENDIVSNSILLIEDNNIKKNLIPNNNNISIKKEECPICEELYIPNDENKLDKCGHSFCHECWFNSLSIKIKENQLTSIKCLKYECQEKLSDEFILRIIKSNEELIEKYKRYKFELDIINDPNKKFCPYPECNSYAILKNIKYKYVKCFNKHEFCFLCLKKPHGKKPCDENGKLDKSLEIFAKNNFIKKCPHCSIITEKINGCNHITCSKCRYQWCWLCNGEYEPEHFRTGKCKGFQFFKPKNEKDIKLAFEGKIILNESQIQQDIEYDNRRVHRFNRRIDTDRFNVGRRRHFLEYNTMESKEVILMFCQFLIFGSLFFMTRKYYPKFLKIQFRCIYLMIFPYQFLIVIMNIFILLQFGFRKRIRHLLYFFKKFLKGEEDF